jgi:hypothetical protein
LGRRRADSSCWLPSISYKRGQLVELVPTEGWPASKRINSS